jgi:plastocyanin
MSILHAPTACARKEARVGVGTLPILVDLANQNRYDRLIDNDSHSHIAMKITRLLLALAILPLFAAAAGPEITVVIKDHRFVPAEVKVPAGQKVKLIVDNQDATPEEFESHELNREKVIAGKSKGAVFIGPLKPGRYPFIGEFNEATAKGVVVAE